jgi:hypothetical protein
MKVRHLLYFLNSSIFGPGIRGKHPGSASLMGILDKTVVEIALRLTSSRKLPSISSPRSISGKTVLPLVTYVTANKERKHFLADVVLPVPNFSSVGNLAFY